MQLEIRKWHVFVDQTEAPSGQDPLRKVAVVAVIANPYAGKYVEDLQPMINASADIGRQMAERAVQAMAPFKALGLGKGGIAGTAGEQEHVNALLTTAFAAGFLNAASICRVSVSEPSTGPISRSLPLRPVEIAPLA